jgi:hypothetical protein
MSDEDLRTLILDFRQSMVEAFAGVNSRLDAVDGRLDAVDGRLDVVEGRLGGVERRMTGLENQMFEFQGETRDRFRTLETAMFNSMRDMHRAHDERLRRLEDAA